jgi:hypothetical protein
MTARNYSVMPVLVLDQERVSLPRAVKSERGSTRAGDYVLIEFGATWATEGDRHFKVDGQWRQCQIVAVVHSELHVRLSPDPKKAPATAG